MTGRSLHDALLSALCDARVRRTLPAPAPGDEETAALGRCDRDRLEKMARFMSRHYYRERLVRLYRNSLALARRRGAEPGALIDTPVFAPILQEAVLGSQDTAERVAARIEEWLRDVFESKGGPLWWPHLVRYEGAIFRAEAGRRVWRQQPPAALLSGAPRRAPSARVESFDIDMPALAARLDRLSEEDPVPWAVPKSPTRLLLAVSPRGVLRVVRCSDALEGFLALADGQKSAEMILQVCGMDRSSATAALRSLIDIGAIEEGR